MPRTLLALLIAGLLAAGCAGATPAPEAPTTTQTAPTASEPPAPPAAKKPMPLRGYPAPEVTGKDVRTGELVSLSALKGKVVLINFWATWCPPCRQEMPDLQTLQNELGDRLKVVAVGGDSGESAEKLLAYADDQQLKFTVLHDKGMAIREYRAVALPTSFLIDQNGIIREKVQGAMSLELMRQLVAETEEAGKKQP